VDTVEVEYGTTIEPITPTVPEGMLFKGWGYYPETMPDQDITIAGTAVPVYTLTIDYDTELGTAVADQETEIEAGSHIGIVITAAEGYEIESVTFTNADGTTPNNYMNNGRYYVQFGSQNVTCDIAFKEAGVTTYNIWNGTIVGGSVSANPSTAAAGETVKLTPTPYEGYVLQELKVTDGQTYLELNDDYEFEMPAGNVWVDATFVNPDDLLDKYTLTYMLNDETVYATYSVAEGKELPTPNDPEMEGYTFTGWEGWPTDGLMPAYELTLTAQFAPRTYTLTYQVDGAFYGEQTYEFGESVSALSTPSKSGYTFSGWEGLPSTMPNYDMVVDGWFAKDVVYTTVEIASSTGYSTFCCDTPLDFSTVRGMRAYVATSISDTEVRFIQVTGTVAAGTGLLLIGETTDVPVADEGVEYYNNLLEGVMSTDFTAHSANQYVLVVKNGIVKFADTANKAATVPVGKAYLQAPANSRLLVFSFDDSATAIDAVVNDDNHTTDCFNLKGQRVANPAKGLYIANGKKLVKK
jgi:hypothetical protein